MLRKTGNVPEIEQKFFVLQTTSFEWSIAIKLLLARSKDGVGWLCSRRASVAMCSTIHNATEQRGGVILF